MTRIREEFSKIFDLINDNRHVCVHGNIQQIYDVVMTIQKPTY